MAPYYYITYSAFCITGMGPMGPCTLHAFIDAFPISPFPKSHEGAIEAPSQHTVAFTPHFTAHHPPSSLHIMHVTIT